MTLLRVSITVQAYNPEPVPRYDRWAQLAQLDVPVDAELAWSVYRKAAEHLTSSTADILDGNWVDGGEG